MRMVSDSSVVSGNRMRSKGHKLKHKKFHFDMMKSFFTMRVAELWSRLPMEVMESPSLEKKTHVDVFLCHLL